ncbi:MAG TPA: serine/threonine-protein kinase, partial [Polyangia bacterium]|nr:serine/threonine-protein kinase [Polyangia bacterium]
KQLEARVQNLESIVCSVDLELNTRLNKLLAQQSSIGALSPFAGAAGPTKSLPDLATGIASARGSLLAMALQPGQKIAGRYTIEREIGRGGMGAVYEGVHLRLNRRVAVKLMARELATNTEALARFRREAEVTSQLGHPHIVQVFDFGEAPSGEPYLVMEFLEGEDLEGRLRRAGRLSAGTAAHIIKQIASALAATHGKGIVHRDLKPANVFVLAVEGETDFVKVVDFGISKVKAATTRLTAAAAVMGTPNYMSPEQAAGRVDEIDGATDQWALACIAYELLAGRPPFVGDNIASLLYQVVHEAPSPLAAHALGLPAGVDAVLTRALAKKPGERFESVAAFSRAFESAAAGVVATAPVVAPAPAALAVAATGLAGTYAPVASPPKAAETTFSAAAGEALATRAPTSSDRRWRGIGIGAFAVAAIALGAVVVTRSGGGAAPAVPSASAPSTPPSTSAAAAPAVAAPAAAVIPAAQPPKPSEAAPGDEHAARARHKKGRGAPSASDLMKAAAAAPVEADALAGTGWSQPKAKPSDATEPAPTWPPQPKAKAAATPPQPAPEADAPTWPPQGTTPDTDAPPPPKKRKRLMQRIFGD